MSGTESTISANQADRQMVTLGILLTLGGVLVFSVIDALGKFALGGMGLGQLLLFRSFTALVLMAPLLVRSGPRAFAQVTQPGLQIVRMVLTAVESSAFFLAVSFLPLADVVTFYLASPIFTTILAMIFLRERVGWRRWVAILVGFVGVVLALGPSVQVASLPALVALAGSLMFSILMILTRYLRATPDIVLISMQLFGSLGLGIIMLPFTYVAIAPLDVWPTVVMGALVLVGHFAINRSLKAAPASTVAPFHYTLIIWATIFGYFVFGDVPSLATVAGAALIIGAGLFIYFREQQLSPEEEPIARPETPDV